VSNPSQSIARVYAQALYEVAEEQGAVGDVLQELRFLHDLIWSDEGQAIREFVLSPRIDRERKWAVVRPALEDRVSRPTLGLMRLLIQKGREAVLDNIAGQFERFRDLAENRIHAHLTVATALDEAFLADVKTRLETSSGKIVDLHQEIDPEVLGGAAIRVGDRVIDRTLRTKLASLRQRLLESANQ